MKFPFTEFAKSTESHETVWALVEHLFSEVQELQAFESIRNSRQQEDYIMSSHCNVVLTTTDHLLQKTSAISKFNFTTLVCLETQTFDDFDFLFPAIETNSLKKVICTGSIKH